MAKRTVGIQLIIFGGERVKTDLPGVLDVVADAGYQAVETGFFADRISGKEFKKMLDDRGLRHVGVHWGGMHADKIGPVIDWMAATGGTDIPLSDNTLANAPLELYKQRAEEYTAAGRLAAQAGITVSYHNHSWEFVEQDGRLPLEVLYEAVDPKFVQACIDVYWVRDGGADPAAFVSKWGKRLRILHAKDSYLEEAGKRSFAPVGSGVLDFPAIIKAAEPSPCPWIVVEQDTPNPGETAESCTVASRKYLRETLGL
jgi:sugar phosphate isomerase/epimerase